MQTKQALRMAFSLAYSQVHHCYEHHLVNFMLIEVGLGLARVLLLAISLLLLYSGAWRASKDKHLEMLVAVFGATYAWTWRTPAGQVINRFSSDMASLDDTLFRACRPVIETYLSITFRILTVSSLIPLFLLPSILLAGIALYIGHRYRFASTAVKHIYAASLTPLHHSVAETASGLTTIHAFRNERLLLDKFKADVDHHVQAWNAVSDLQRWLAVRMDLCVGLISFSVAILAIMKQHANASTVGLSLTLTTGLCTSLLCMSFFPSPHPLPLFPSPGRMPLISSDLVYLSSLLEVEMTSYYRIESYARDVPQESKPCEPVVGPDDWPAQGAVNVQDLTAGYSWDENEVLKDVDLNAKSGERVAIVGRTGSGKSSLALSLLRLTTRLRGSTNIDGIDVESLEVDQLRQRISLIPQDPTLFDGSLRFNLDPSGQACDRYLQTVLDDVAGTLNKWHLDDLVDGNGKNFSHGERQLIALGRAIVRQNRIVILDEGTASLDDASEARIHAVLHARFRDCTVIAIAHRLHSILDFDRVLVLDGGRVVEQGNPRELLTAGRGWFQTLYIQQCGPEAD